MGNSLESLRDKFIEASTKTTARGPFVVFVEYSKLPSDAQQPIENKVQQLAHNCLWPRTFSIRDPGSEFTLEKVIPHSPFTLLGLGRIKGKKGKLLCLDYNG